MELNTNDMRALESLEQKLAVIRDRVRGVVSRHANGFYLCGRPGTSKSFTVRTTLEAEHCPYHFHDGHLTPMGLFDLLEECHDRVILLDDISSIFRQPISLQLLLAALGKQPDGTVERIIKYRRQRREETIHFTGAVVAISNLQLEQTPLLGAIRSRVHYLNFDPTDEQIAALMRRVVQNGWPRNDPEVSPAECAEVAEFVIGESRRLGVRLEMRLLLDKALPDFLQHRNGETEAHWRDLVATTLEQRLVELQYPTTPRPSRQDRIAAEQELAAAILKEFDNRDERLGAWKERTGGKSERAFYRRVNGNGNGQARI